MALPPGTAQFVKTDISAQKHAVFGPPVLGQTGLTGSLLFSAGLLLPFAALLKNNKGKGSENTDDTQHQQNLGTFLSDRFYMGGPIGGPMSLRGFDNYGVGPRSNVGREHIGETTTSSFSPLTALNIGGGASALTSPTDALGGISRLSLTALFSVPLPVRNAADKLEGIRAFVFCTAGGLGSPNFWSKFCSANQTRANQGAGGSNGKAPSPSLSGLFGAPRVSLGGGLSIAFTQMARMEISYSVPLISAKSDVTKAFQIGFGFTIS